MTDRATQIAREFARAGVNMLSCDEDEFAVELAAALRAYRAEGLELAETAALAALALGHPENIPVAIRALKEAKP